MRKLRSVLSVCTALSLAGCATHPLPKHVTRETTRSIVAKIYCEGREALDSLTIKVLRGSNHEINLAYANGIEDGTFFARNFEDPRIFRTLDERTQGVILQFTLSSVVFDFRFDITETNDNTIDARFRHPFAKPMGTFTFGFIGGKKTARKNERKFQAGTTFFALHQKQFDPARCDNVSAKHRHLVYPITGRIGLEEVFDTFLNLTVFTGGLGAKKAGVTQKKLDRFNDTLTFTTTLKANVNPKITLDAIPDHRFRLVSVEGMFNNDRVDIHEVGISVATEEEITRKLLQKAARNQARADSLRRAFKNANIERAEQTLNTIFELEDRVNAAGIPQ